MRGVDAQRGAERSQRAHLHFMPPGLLMHQHPIHLHHQDGGVLRPLDLVLCPDSLALPGARDRCLRLRLGHRPDPLGQPPCRLVAQRRAQGFLDQLHRRRKGRVHRRPRHHPRQPRRDGPRPQPQRRIQRRLTPLAGRTPIVGAAERVVAHQTHQRARALPPLQHPFACRAACPTRQPLGVPRRHPLNQPAQEHAAHLLDPLFQCRQVHRQHLRHHRLQRLPHQHLHLLYDGAGQLCSVHGYPPRDRCGGVSASPPLGRVPPSVREELCCGAPPRWASACRLWSSTHADAIA